MRGTRIGGRYEVEEELGRGRFGAVYAARDPGGQRVALKLLSAFDGASRFRREAEILKRIPPHRNVVALLDAGSHGGGLPFLVLELVTGPPLRALLASEWPSVERSVAIAEGVLRGLAHLHAAGVLHRDLSAGNVLLDERTGEARIADFGLALDLERTTRLTKSGEILGAPWLLAPEQLEGGEVTSAADVYAVSALLFELVTRRPPFGEGLPAGELVRRILEETPPSADSVAPSVPAHLARAIARGLAKRPQDRPRSAEELARLLRPGAVELALAPGKTFGRYEVGERVASLGAALVLRARDARTGREVTLEVLADPSDSLGRRRFAAEAGALRALRHPGIAAVLDAGEALEAPYLALDVAGATTLAEAKRRGVPAPQVARILGRVAEALACAHAAGIVHGALGPECVLLDARSEPRLVGFAGSASTGRSAEDDRRALEALRDQA
jgi:serine/threonine protein kinase